MTKWTREQLNPEMKHPLEQLVGVIGMLAILRYGYLFIDTDKTRGEILVWLVVGFAVIYILERVGKRLVRRLPIIRKRERPGAAPDPARGKAGSAHGRLAGPPVARGRAHFQQPGFAL
ncbi:MAG: hypothetical protein ACK411_15060 [Exiguobacterium mexicanum]